MGICLVWFSQILHKRSLYVSEKTLSDKTGTQYSPSLSLPTHCEMFIQIKFLMENKNIIKEMLNNITENNKL